VTVAGDSQQRLAAIAHTTSHRKPANPSATAALLGPVFRTLARLGAMRWFVNRQHLVTTLVTNLRGPDYRLSFLKAPITEVIPVSPITGNVTVASPCCPTPACSWSPSSPTHNAAPTCRPWSRTCRPNWTCSPDSTPHARSPLFRSRPTVPVRQPCEQCERRPTDGQHRRPGPAALTAGRLLGGLGELEFTGRRSDGALRLPVQYARDADRVVVHVGVHRRPPRRRVVPPTITAVADRLLAEGVIDELKGQRRGRPGRPAAVLQVRPQARFIGVLGIARGGLQAAVIGSDATILGRRVRPVDYTRPNGGMHLLVELLGRVVEDLGLTSAALDTLVLSVPAPVHHGRPTTLRADVPGLRPQYAGRVRWIGADPGAELEAMLGTRLTVENDANLAALGEAVYGTGRPFSVIVYVMMAGGLGGGVVVDKRLVRGAVGLAGEVGHLHLDDAGPLCVCGARGCLGACIGFVDTMKRMEPAFDQERIVERLSELCARGHSATFRLLCDLGEEIGNALGAACAVLDPDAIIVDGTLQNAVRPVIDGIRAGIERHAPAASLDSVAILPGALHDTAQIHGALALSSDTT
jgi:predicted NBD/HSP70 family sugar kinase